MTPCLDSKNPDGDTALIRQLRRARRERDEARVVAAQLASLLARRKDCLSGHRQNRAAVPAPWGYQLPKPHGQMWRLRHLRLSLDTRRRRILHLVQWGKR